MDERRAFDEAARKAHAAADPDGYGGSNDEEIAALTDAVELAQAALSAADRISAEQARVIREKDAVIARIDAERHQAEQEADRWKDRATDMQEQSTRSLNDYAAECRKAADRWYHDPVTGEPIEFNEIRSLMLIASEVFEAFEGVRKGLMDDHLPQYPMEAVELVDTLIRDFDYAGDRGWDVERIYRDKLAYNAGRADHQAAARSATNGKKF